MTDAATQEANLQSSVDKPLVINDLSMVVATVNGTGSQTSNMALIRALFRMGIPVSGKNLFPSNIQGLPTWFTIRASGEGFVARRETIEILVAMNETTFQEDLAGLVQGGVCFYPDNWTQPRKRQDVVYYPMPVQDLIKEQSPPRDLRDYIANMVYVGIVSEILGIEMAEIRAALETHFHGRAKPIDMNMSMVEAAAKWANENLTKQDPYKGPDGGVDPHRRQYLISIGRRLRRGQLRRLVPDHTCLEPGRCPLGVLAPAPQGSRDRKGDLCCHSGRG